MKGKNLKILGLLIGCLVGISVFSGLNFAVAQDETPEPTAITLGTTTSIAAGTFSNDSKIVEYSLTIPAGVGVNLTLQNANGSKLSWSIQVDYETKYSDCMVTEVKCISSETAGDIAKYEPAYKSFVYVALDEVTLTICVKAEGHWNRTANQDDAMFQMISGAIVPTQVWSMGSNGLATGTTSYSANFSALPLTGSGIQAKVFNVSADGWYLFTMNASEGDAGEGSASLTAAVTQLDKANAESFSQGVTKAYGKYKSVGTISRMTWPEGFASENYSTYMPMYLEKGEQYLVGFSMGGGYQVKGKVDLSWAPLNLTEGVLGAAGNAVNFASSDITVVREGNAQWSTWLLLDELDADTLYDLNLAGISDAADWWMAQFSLFDNTWNGMPVTFNQSGKLFGLSLDCYDEASVNGQSYEDYLSLIYSETDIPSNNLGGMNGTDEDWGKKNIAESSWNVPLVKITVMNTTAGKAMGTLPTTTLTVQENAAGVPDLPASGSTMTKIYNGTGDSMGLYKLEGMKGKEVDFTFGNMSVMVNPTFALNFYGECDVPSVGQSVVANAYGQSSFTFDNDSIDWGIVYAKTKLPANEADNMTYWDSDPVDFEVAVFVDTVYVVIDVNGGTETTPWALNTSTFTMNYAEQDFLKSGSEWTAGRDNKIQVLTASVGPCTKAVLEPVYGACCSGTVTAYMVDCCDLCVGYIQQSGGWTINYPIPDYWPNCVSASGYMVLSISSLTAGSVWKLTLSTPSAAIPGFPMFFTLIASLSVVAALVWKRKRQ